MLSSADELTLSATEPWRSEVCLNAFIIKILFALFKKFRKLRHGARYIYLLRADGSAGSASDAG